VPESRSALLTALGRALASVGHELNNVVGVVQSYAVFIQESAQDANVLADAQVIRTTADKAAVIARQLLAFGHPREQGAEALELGPFVLDLQGFLRRAFGDECPVAVQLGAEAAVISVQRAALARLLLELVVLLREASAAGSGLRLSVEFVEQDAVRLCELGLREERFGPAPGAARALDLTWAELRVGGLGGALQVAPTAEAGLALALRFPLLAAPRDGARHSNAPREARGSETVLVVEENGELRQAICRMLEAAGYRALEAEDAGTARSLGLEGGVPVDLLLSSSSAGADDEALLNELRHLHPNLGVLHPSKPFSSAALQGAVRAALDDRRRLSHRVPVDATRVLSLVVDDDPHVRLALSRILADVGADVVTAPSGLHALQKLQALPIDVVIADQLMPGMEGTRLLETAYKTWPRVMRVVYTGYLSSALVVDAVNRASVHKVLAKDMSPALLREQLSEVVAEIRAGKPV
jgi:CheY-like chemotaxis protein